MRWLLPLLVLAACTPAAGPDLPSTAYNYASLDLPRHFLEADTVGGFSAPTLSRQAPMAHDSTPAGNPVTDHGATLGRVLFYDRALSANGGQACASCHRQELGFSDDRDFSPGFDGGETARHSMGLSNARFNFQGSHFWDQRAATLEEQVLMPFQDPVEMGLTLDGLQLLVAEQLHYPALFEAAFGDPEVTTDRISRALAQFVRCILSADSRYDRGRAEAEEQGDDFDNLTDRENLGKRLFLSPVGQGGGECTVCHATEAFVTLAASSNGLDAEPEDPGFGAILGPPRHGTFRAPSLRDVGRRAPYMHDARFATLEEVVEHYNSGLQDHNNLPARPYRGPDGRPIRLGWDADEVAAVVAFLHTLSDDGLATDPRLSDPFTR